MAWTDQDKQAMDNAATDAENDLTTVIFDRQGDETSLVELANWWRIWYPKAGHKRLARILLQYASKEA